MILKSTVGWIFVTVSCSDLSVVHSLIVPIIVLVIFCTIGSLQDVCVIRFTKFAWQYNMLPAVMCILIFQMYIVIQNIQVLLYSGRLKFKVLLHFNALILFGWKLW